MDIKKDLIQIFKVTTIALVLTLGVNYVLAWTGPTQGPPNGNTSAPINVGTTNQVKSAGLGLNSLSVFGAGYFSGNVGVGVASPASKLDVSGGVKIGNDTGTCGATKEGTTRYNSTNKTLEFCNGTGWTALGGGLCSNQASNFTYSLDGVGTAGSDYYWYTPTTSAGVTNLSYLYDGNSSTSPSPAPWVFQSQHSGSEGSGIVIVDLGGSQYTGNFLLELEGSGIDQTNSLASEPWVTVYSTLDSDPTNKVSWTAVQTRYFPIQSSMVSYAMSGVFSGKYLIISMQGHANDPDRYTKLQVRLKELSIYASGCGVSVGSTSGYQIIGGGFRRDENYPVADTCTAWGEGDCSHYDDNNHYYIGPYCPSGSVERQTGAGYGTSNYWVCLE